SPLATPFHSLVSIFPIPSRYISIFRAPPPRYFSPSLSLAAALPRLAAGEAVARIAVDLGYQTPSAFSAMFRRLTGSTPSRYFALSDSA
ncbi:helix-turn-helix domain-containing protein, partial [Pseudomonas aeruginosa]|uniref:helix-turn-helix domain-containing protein n=1 Tax=Pseudomonas aeruginosa TaxID=287 RepID=UPI0028CD50E4